MPPVESGIDPVKYPVSSLTRVALVCGLSEDFVRERARDVFGHHPGSTDRLDDRQIVTLVAALRPHLPTVDEFDDGDDAYDEPLPLSLDRLRERESFEDEDNLYYN